MRTRVCLLLVFGMLFAFVATAAETVCISPAVGVPGQNNVPPHWWDATGEPGSGMPVQPPYNTCVTDPRWVESTAIAYDSGVGEDVLFRALYDTNNVYLSWLIKNSPGGVPTDNRIYFGYQGAGTPELPAGDRIVRMDLNDAGAIQAGGTLNFATFRIDGTGHSMVGDATPAWLSSTARSWVNTPSCAPTCNCVQNPAGFWAVQVRLPRSEIVAGPTFKFWFEVRTVPGAGTAVPFSWPRIGGKIVPDALGGAFPLSSVWNSFQFTGCTPSGISIEWWNVGAHTPADTNLTSSIQYKKVPDDAATHPQNVLAARPTNNSGTTIPAGRLGATFRIANWESGPHWEDGVDINELWSIVQCGTDGSPTVVNCGENGRNKADIGPGTATDANEIIMVDPATMVSTPWALTNAQLAPYRDGVGADRKRADNCMLVELKTVTNLGDPPLDLFFDRRSVRRNMIFSHTSDFVHLAAATNKGLPPMAGGRDMYILVEALNMPYRQSPKAPVPQIPVKPGHIEIGMLDQPMMSQGGNTVSVDDDQLLESLTTAGRIDPETLDKALPTYRVHVYYDTGIREREGSREIVILNAQGAFGYYLAYTPPVVGWRHLLEAQGYTLEEIEPNFYRIRRVPNGGVVPLKISVRSLHPGESDDPPLGGTRAQWRAFVDAGVNFPDNLDGRYSINAGLERILSSAWSIEGIVGYHTFEAEGRFDLEAWQLSANAMRFFGTGKLRPYLAGGVGLYTFDPGQPEFGWNGALGLLWELNAKWGVEGVYNYHDTDSLEFSTAKVGLRWHF